jgi:hypothetical protein
VGVGESHFLKDGDSPGHKVPVFKTAHLRAGPGCSWGVAKSWQETCSVSGWEARGQKGLSLLDLRRLVNKKQVFGKRLEPAQPALRMPGQEGMRAYPLAHLSESCLQGPPMGPSIRELFLGPCKFCPKSMPKTRLKTPRHCSCHSSVFQSPTRAGVLSSFTSINFFSLATHLLSRLIILWLTLDKNSMNSKPVSRAKLPQLPGSVETPGSDKGPGRGPQIL